MENAASALRFVHITAGITALAVFWVPLLVTKGSLVHRRVGWVYVVAMFVAAATALLVVPIRIAQRSRGWGMPLFLAYIAVLAFTAAFYGVRVLRQKKRTGVHDVVVDWVPPCVLLASTLGIAAYGIANGFWLPVYFAPVGLVVALPQLRALRTKPDLKGWWLVQHLTAMLISCITTVTAFVVVNAGRFLGAGRHPVAWLGPVIVGGVLVAYWKRRYATGLERR
jgi:hypothetical protein